jgi:ribosomal protein S18 acetylase RimI-like enzyme
LKFLDSDIIKMLQENENSFCNSWHSKVVNVKNKFFILHTAGLNDDYFLNRVLINEHLDFNRYDHFEIEKTMHALINVSNAKKITLYLHITSNHSLLEEYLIKENFEKIDEVTGLQYLDSFDYNFSTLNTSILVKPFNGSQILIADSYDELKMWVKAYCTIFGISGKKEGLIYKILQDKFNMFDFVLFKKNVKDEAHENVAGCSVLFHHKNCMALYCLGTKKEYRCNKVATNIINFSIKFGRRQGYPIFGLQTLQSDNLLSFYERQGFAKIYTNKIYRISDR